jgi:flagellar basal body rod protein FlgG
MLRVLQAASTGMEAQQMNFNSIAKNLANVNTTGFKKNKIEFQDMLYQKKCDVGVEQGAGNLTPTWVEVGNGMRVVSNAKSEPSKNAAPARRGSTPSNTAPDGSKSPAKRKK